MLRYSVHKGRTSKCNFIAYYDKLVNSYADADSIKTDSKKKLQEDIRRKAEAGRSRYMKYIEVNPSLTKPSVIYDNYVPTSKLVKLTKLRTSCHSLAIEKGRHAGTKKPIEERLCHCESIDCYENAPNFRLPVGTSFYLLYENTL